MTKDRREAPRFNHAIDITYVMDDGTKFRVCKMKNISVGGATVQLDHPASPTEMIQLSLPESDEIIKAEIVWCQVSPGSDGPGIYDCGLKYKDVINEKVNEILEEIESRK